jgi:predicted acetyltransferase
MDLRPATSAEADDFLRAVLAAFHHELEEEERELYGRQFEPDRSLAWFDDGRIVAGATVFTRRLTVPGAVVDCAAVTGIGVRSTHRRRGLLTDMMRRQLADVRERGEPVAALWASEGSIYGRFGYGPSAGVAALRARRPAARLADPPPADAPLVAGPAGDHVDAMRPVYERVRALRPGMLDRPGLWWEGRLFDPVSRRDGAQPLQAAVVDGGYALYAVRRSHGEDGPDGEVLVRELVAETPAARARLWAFLLDQDLTSATTWHLAPVDEPLALMLADPRAVRATVGDGLWVRIVDVGAALSQRAYAVAPDVVLEVSDAFCAWNEGRWRLGADGCERTRAEPDLALDAAALGAAYLGGTTLLELAAAGRVRELRSGALLRAARALRADVEPWCPEIF